VIRKYEATGPEAEFEPGSGGRVLRNLLGITRVRDMNEAESQALELAQEAALNRYRPDHRFTADDIGALHRLWLGPIYSWAGEYRSVNIGKAGFQFAHAPLIDGLMAAMERGVLRLHTPCREGSDAQVAQALAEVHAELILVHPFREGNGRLARLLALLMALQAGLPPLNFSPLAGRGKRTYIAGIHAAMGRDYAPLAALFVSVIERSRRGAVSNAR
jgi:cell filamentation protein